MAKKVNVAEKKRERLLKKLEPQDELRFIEKKLKKEGNKKLFSEAEEEEKDYSEEQLMPEDSRHAREVEDKKIEEGEEEGFISGEKAEEVYDLEEAEELVEDDEINAGEEGFVRGFEEEEEEHFSKKKKKKKKKP